MKRIFFVALILLTAGTALGQEKWPIRQEYVQNPTMLRTLLQNRFDLVEGDVANLQAYSNLGRGEVFYVHSGTGADTYAGTSKVAPKATLDAAVALCTANRGDIIYVMQGHNEALTAADGVDLDVAGITVLGMGYGSDRPRFDFDNSAGEFVIGAAAVRVSNLTFLPSVTGITHCIDVENAGDWAIIDHCEFLEGEAAGTDEFVDCIQVGTTATNVTIAYNVYTNIGGTGPNNFIDLSAATISNPRLIGNVIKGEFAEAGIWAGAAVPTDVVCWGNVVENRTTGQFAIEFQGAATGVYGDNWCYTDGSTTAIDPGSLKAVAPNWIVTAIDKSPVMFPAQDDAATNLIGVDDADNLAATTNVAANRDGSILERLEHLLDTTLDDETSNLIGFDDADNAAATTNVAANRDGSILERLEHLLDGLIDDETSNLIGFDDADNSAATTNVVANRDGSLLERLEHVLDMILDDETTNFIGVNDADNAADSSTVVANRDGSLLERLEHILDGLIDDETTNLIGFDDADNAAATTNITDNADGSVLERLEHIQVDTDKIDGATLAVSPTAGSLARFIASGGTALGTALADSKSLVDAIGTNGTTVADTATGLAGMIGVDDADNAMATTNVTANRDGSVFERQEAIQTNLGPYAKHPNYFTVDVNLASATWNTVAAHEVVTVTGACRVQILIEVTETCVTTGNTGTMALGFEGNAAAVFAATGLDSGGTTFTAGDVVSAVYGAAATTPASGANTSTGITGALFDVVAVGGKDIGYTIATNAATDGTVIFHIWWQPLDATGACAAGAGGAL